MRILLLNDDGFNHKNLEETRKALLKYGEVFVSAPKTPKSGASVSISIKKEGYAFEVIDNHTIVIDGTPADCAYVGLAYFKDIDLVVSGTNNGYNEGYDSIFSGTVGAGLTASLFSKKVVMLSCDFDDYENIFTKVQFAMDYIFKNNLLLTAPVISVNFPQKKFKGPWKFKMGHTPFFPLHEWVEIREDGRAMGHRDFNSPSLPLSDKDATNNGYFSITPLHASFEDLALFNELKVIVEKNET